MYQVPVCIINRFHTYLHFSSFNGFVGQANEFWGWRRVQEFQEPLVRMVPLIMDPLLQGRPSSNTTEYLALITSLGSTKIFKLLEDGHYEDTSKSMKFKIVAFSLQLQKYPFSGQLCKLIGPSCKSERKSIFIYNHIIIIP